MIAEIRVWPEFHGCRDFFIKENFVSFMENGCGGNVISGAGVSRTILPL
jgi:hypothetical protein